MSAATITQVMPSAGLVEADPPSLARLVLVEMRKMVDTRAGKWLFAFIAVLYVALAAVSLLVTSQPGMRDTANVLMLQSLPAGFLLPVVGVLSVTSEWSQRTALSTFTLVPSRLRTAAAKLLAGMVFALGSVVLTVGIAYLTTGLATLFYDSPVDWHVPISLVGTVALFQLLNVIMGIGFGMLFLNSPLAIVLLFVLPIVFTILRGMIPGFEDVAKWLDTSTAIGLLVEDPAPTAEEWAQIATSSALWLGVPLLIGAWRLVRSEVK